MPKNRFRALVALVIGAGLSAWSAIPASAVDDRSGRFDLLPTADSLPVAHPPRAASAEEEVTVVLRLAGDSVAETMAGSGGRRLAAVNQGAVKDALRGRQEALRGPIEARGGAVLAEYQAALNGIKVRAPRGRLRELAGLPGVVSVLRVGVATLDNAVSVPYLDVPEVWNGASGLHGEGVRVGIIDTGIDYTHANFAGPGTPAAYATERSRIKDGEQPDPELFGPASPKVKGGIDLVGDDYNASSKDPARRVPHPSTSPLDCQGHGSHVAGTAAGFGVRADGSTYEGAYDSGTHNQSFRVGPGVAPRAELYAIRVFGCEGSTNVTVDAIEWSVDHGMDVINMSLGSAYGSADDASAVASENAARAGVVVVASAGNSGPAPYITGSPAAGRGTISVAAVDSTASFPGIRVTLSTGQVVIAQNSNGASFTDGTSMPVKVLRQSDGRVALGCNESEYRDSEIAGRLVVTQRGVCARVDRAIFAQRHGAAAVAMINDGPAYPPFEGQILDGTRPVTIPFLGVKGPLGAASDGDRLVAADGGTAQLANTPLPNPGYRGFASFTSGGPRLEDSALKPDISAPGVSVQSTAVGTGNGGVRMSGTSMAAPHVTGVAALTVQAHPEWAQADVRASIVNTASPDKVAGFQVRLGGSGLVQPVRSTRAQAVATTADGDTNLSFGFSELTSDYDESLALTVRNLGEAAVSFQVGSRPLAGSPHAVEPSRAQVTIGPGGSAPLSLRLRVPVVSIGDASSFRQVSGLVTLTPTEPAMNGGATLTVPYFLVPRARSTVDATLDGEFSTSVPNAGVELTNNDSPVKGTADFYAWGLRGDPSKPAADRRAFDIRAVGVQSFPFRGSDRLLVFGVNTRGRLATANKYEFDIPIDTTGSGRPNWILFATDEGLVVGGGFNGVMASFLVDLSKRPEEPGYLREVARLNAPASGYNTNGSFVEIPLIASMAGITAARPRFAYTAESDDLFTDEADIISTPARFNAFHSSVSQGQFAEVPSGSTRTVPVSIDAAEYAQTPALGLMVVSLDNRAGPEQATLLEAGDAAARVLIDSREKAGVGAR